jgi:hypothetical protein
MRELLGMSALKEGVVVAVEEQSQQQKEFSHMKVMSRAETSDRRNSDTPIGYSG